VKENLDHLLWGYMCPIAAPSVPKADPQIPPGQTNQLAGYDIGRCLGHGSYGMVRLLLPNGAAEQQEQHEQSNEQQHAVKVISKSSLLSVSSILNLKREIDIMSLLGSEWRHPNVVGLCKAMCSQTHVFLIMDYAGPTNLYRRLAYRDLSGGRQQLLTVERSLSVLQQVVAAVGHLHLGPQVCHRDVKPENFIVSEIDNGPIALKLTDFNVSCFQKEGTLCRSSCGTIPFLAPEVALEDAYCGRAADIWSLGVVVLEILCRSHILTTALQISCPGGNAPPSQELVEEIAANFSDHETVQRIVHDYARPELNSLQPAVLPMLQGMLTVGVRQRWGTHQVVSTAQTLTVGENE